MIQSIRFYNVLQSKVLTSSLHCVSFEGAFRGTGVLMTAFTLTAAALRSGVENQEHLEKHIDPPNSELERFMKPSRKDHKEHNRSTH